MAQNVYDFPEFEKETFKFVKQPLIWEAGDWLKLGLITGAALLTTEADQSIREAVIRNPGWESTVPIQIGAVWGGWFPTPILAIGFGLHGWLENNRSTKKVSYEILQAVLYAELAKSIFTVSIGRARPYSDKGPGVFRPFTFLDVHYQSFPGGHATAATALSTVLAANTSSVPLKIAAYVPTACTVIARVYQDAHWASDQVFGVAIGFFAARWVIGLHEHKNAAVQISSVYPPTISVAF